MNVSGSGLPLHVARAYGMTGPSAPARPTAPAAPGRPDAPTRPNPVRETFAPSAAAAPTAATALRIDPATPASPAATERIGRLVGGRVAGAVDFSGSAPTASRGDVLPLYTRAADKVEASVAVRLGGSLDVRG